MLPLVCLFLMTPLPPISTLFPYTTLFRSWGVFVMRRVTTFVVDLDGTAASIHVTQGPPPAAWVGRGQSETDRKSTRLNSSHLGISYAVFCLKKKNSAEP